MIDLDLLCENLLEEIETNKSLEVQCVTLEDKKYYFEEVYEEDWCDCGKYAHSYTVYRVSIYTLNDEFVEDTELYLRHDVTRSGSYFSYYEYDFETPYRVKKIKKIIEVEEWVTYV